MTEIINNVLQSLDKEKIAIYLVKKVFSTILKKPFNPSETLVKVVSSFNDIIKAEKSRRQAIRRGIYNLFWIKDIYTDKGLLIANKETIKELTKADEVFE